MKPVLTLVKAGQRPKHLEADLCKSFDLSFPANECLEWFFLLSVCALMHSCFLIRIILSVIYGKMFTVVALYMHFLQK